MKLLQIILVLLLAVLFAGCAGQQARPSEETHKEADYYYKMGISSLNEGNIKMAYVQLHKAYELDQNNKEVLNSLGIVFMQLGEEDKALDFFNRVLQIDDRYSEAYNSIGVINLHRGRYQEAIDAFNRAISNPLYQYPDRAYYNLGVSYYRMKRFDDAIRSFQSALMLSPSFTMPHYGLALAFNKKGDYGNAAIMLNRAITLDQKYRGNREAYKKDLQQKYNQTRGVEATDLADYMEILNY